MFIVGLGCMLFPSVIQTSHMFFECTLSFYLSPSFPSIAHISPSLSLSFSLLHSPSCSSPSLSPSRSLSFSHPPSASPLTSSLPPSPSLSVFHPLLLSPSLSLPSRSLSPSVVTNTRTPPRECESKGPSKTAGGHRVNGSGI